MKLDILIMNATNSLLMCKLPDLGQFSKQGVYIQVI